MITRKAPQELQVRWSDRFASSKDVATHTHAETELVAVTKGRCRIRAGKELLEGVPGSIFVLPAGVSQYQETLGATRTTYLGFDLPPGLFDETARVLKMEPTDPALQWMEQLCDGPRVRLPLSDDVARTLLTALLRRLTDADAATGSQARFHPAVRAARIYLDANLQLALTLSVLARTVGASASHLSALFTAQCGVSPMQYLQRLRLERACWLLANPYLRIHEVAESCGYEDVNYFTRLFRRRFKVSPGRWRRRKV